MLHPVRRRVWATGLAVLAASLAATAAATGAGATASAADTLVSTGSPSPVLAEQAERAGRGRRPGAPEHRRRGLQRRDRHGGLQRRAGRRLPVHPGRRRLGHLLLADSGASWTQPTYTGLTGRNCLGAAGRHRPAVHADHRARSARCPNYAAAGLVSDGDPARRLGAASACRRPLRVGQRLAAVLREPDLGRPGRRAVQGRRGDRGLAHRRRRRRPWSAPSIASRQTGALFSDKEQIWADNAASSRFFGNVYVCYAAFRGNGKGGGGQPLNVLTSRDGGDDAGPRPGHAGGEQHPQPQRLRPLGLHGAHGLDAARSTCSTTSSASTPRGAAPGQIQMITSDDGGAHFAGR